MVMDKISKNILQKYKHIAFDLDGTLVHTLPEYRHKIVPNVVGQLGGEILSIPSIDRFWFESGRDNIIQNEFKVEPKLFWDLFRKVDTPKRRSEHTFAHDDAESTLRNLKNQNKIISIITGAPHWIAQMEIAKLNGAPHDFYLSINESDYDEKPNPASFHHVIGILKTKPSETVYIGNSNEDAYYAKNAGVDFIYLKRKEHEFELGDYAISTIQTLADLAL
jgi:HAD superfamily hydrolase (TIGR01549 family)